MSTLVPVVGAAFNDQLQKETKTFTAYIANALGKWSGSVIGAQKIKAAVNQRQMLGPSASLKRKNYAMSPLLKLIKEHCITTENTIFVACAGPGKGKTTACHAVLGRYAKKGVAFSPGEFTGTYASSMLLRLGLDPDNPPSGWLVKLCEELQAPPGENPAVLMLDDFMNLNPDDELDMLFLINLKGAIRGLNIVVFVFTINDISANKMISWNGMVSIVPLASIEVIGAHRRKLKKQAQSKTKTDFTFDWNRDMAWDLTELKFAILENPNHRDKSEAEKDLLKGKIDAIYQSKEETERKDLNPQIVLSELKGTPVIDILESPKDGWISGAWWFCW